MLGFFHNWIAELSKHYNLVTVIALKVGTHDLPANVRVFSLGKESSDKGFYVRKIYYILKFYYLIVRYLRTYTNVFVHQNQEYALLGSLIWKIFGKKIYLWRNHYAGNIVTKIACLVSSKTFYTSDSSYNATFPNAVKMPVGVDLESLQTSEVFDIPANSILMLSRLDPSKKPEIILQALQQLHEEGVSFTADFVGGTSKDKSPHYEAELVQLKDDLHLHGVVKFVGAVPSTETYKYYLSHDIYINVSKSGMLDKTIFKALAAGCVPLTTSLDFNEIIRPVANDTFKVEQDSVPSLVEKLKMATSMSTEAKKQAVKQMQDIVLEKSSLLTLVTKLTEII